MALSKEHRRYIEESILDTFEAAGINSFPIDVFELCHKLKIRVLKYSAYSSNDIDYSDDAFSFYNPKNQEFIIAYNDAIESARVNFSIMHEIGHIQLDHDRSKLTEAEKEVEADTFAQKALAPAGVILKLGLKTDVQISSVFKVSLPCARVITTSLGFILKNPVLRLNEINSPITALFEESINAYINK